MWLFLLILLLHVVMLLTTTTVDNTPISHKYYWYCFYYTWQNKLLQWFYLIVKDMILTREPDTVYLQYSVNLSSEVLKYWLAGQRSEVRHPDMLTSAAVRQEVRAERHFLFVLPHGFTHNNTKTVNIIKPTVSWRLLTTRGQQSTIILL